MITKFLQIKKKNIQSIRFLLCFRPSQSATLEHSFSESIVRYTQSWFVLARLGVSSYPCAAPAVRLYFSRLIVPSWSLVTCTLVTWHQGRRRYIAPWSTRSRCSPDSQVHLSMLWKIKSSIVECTFLLLVLVCSIWDSAKWIARWSKIDVNEW